jgi:hypothetical protein
MFKLGTLPLALGSPLALDTGKLVLHRKGGPAHPRVGKSICRA